MDKPYIKTTDDNGHAKIRYKKLCCYSIFKPEHEENYTNTLTVFSMIINGKSQNTCPMVFTECNTLEDIINRIKKDYDIKDCFIDYDGQVIGNGNTIDIYFEKF